MNYYLTDSIYINNGITFYENDSNSKKITTKNWHHYLGDYGWTKLNLGWRKRLKDDGKSCFGLLDCGGDGDCFFHVLCEALNTEFLSKLRMPKYEVKTLRLLAANEITKNNFKLILENYKIGFEEGDINGEWDPNEIKTIGQLKTEIVKGGDNFWGDHILLQLLQQKLKLNIIILNSNCTVHPMASLDLSENDKTIIIYYLDQHHFQLIGYYDGNLMKTLFKNDELPEIIMNVYNEDCRNNL